jgi:hypothetical protein
VVVKLLFSKDGVGPESKDECGRTPLCRATGVGEKMVTKPLFAKDCVYLDYKDQYG